jgi:hypothetical protein
MAKHKLLLMLLNRQSQGHTLSMVHIANHFALP